MQRTLSRDLPARAGAEVRLEGWVHRRRELAKVSFLILRDRTGLAQVVVPAGSVLPGEETVVEVTGRAVANPVAPGGVEVVEPAISVLGEAEPPPVELFRPSLDATLPTLLDHAAVTLRHPPAAHRVRGGGRGDGRVPRARSSGRRVHRDRHPEDRRVGHRERRQRVRHRLLRPPGVPRPVARSSTSRRWSASSSASTRSVRSSAPSRTTPSRHLAAYTSLDAELGFIADHRDVMAVLADVVRAMDSGRVSPFGFSGVLVPDRHSRRALRGGAAHGRRRPGRARPRPRARTRPRRVGAERARLRLRVRRGVPDGQAAVLHPPAAVGPALVQLVRPALPRRRTGDRRSAAAPLRGLPRRAAPRAASRRQGRTRRTSRRSGTGCRRTVASRSGLERFLARLSGAANVRETALFPRDLHRLTP